MLLYNTVYTKLIVYAASDHAAKCIRLSPASASCRHIFCIVCHLVMCHTCNIGKLSLTYLFSSVVYVYHSDANRQSIEAMSHIILLHSPVLNFIQ